MAFSPLEDPSCLPEHCKELAVVPCFSWLIDRQTCWNAFWLNIWTSYSTDIFFQRSVSSCDFGLRGGSRKALNFKLWSQRYVLCLPQEIRETHGTCSNLTSSILLNWAMRKKTSCLGHIGDDSNQLHGEYSIYISHFKDPVIKPPDFRDSIGLNTPSREDWSRLTSAFQLETVPAGHMDCLQVQAAARWKDPYLSSHNHGSGKWP